MPKISTSTLMAHLYADADKVARRMAEVGGSTCRKGCTHCCGLLAIITLADGVFLAEGLLERPDWKEWLPKLTESSKNYLYFGINKMNWFEKKILCVFLKDGLCSVYEKRPAACRFHYVITPPADCSPEAPKDTKTAQLDMIGLEAETAWRVSMAMHPFPLGAPIPIMILYCMEVLSRDGEHKEKHADIEKAKEGIPNPEEWMTTFGKEMLKVGEELKQLLGPRTVIPSKT